MKAGSRCPSTEGFSTDVCVEAVMAGSVSNSMVKQQGSSEADGLVDGCSGAGPEQQESIGATVAFSQHVQASAMEQACSVP